MEPMSMTAAWPDSASQSARPLPPAIMPSAAGIIRPAVLWLFFFAFVVCTIANAFHLFAFPLTIDGEVFAFADEPDSFLANERWTAYLLARLLMPRSTIPIVPDLLAIGAAAAAYTLTAVTWRSRIGVEHFVAAPLALAFPIFFEVMFFPSYSYGVFIGFVFASSGVWLMARGTVRAHVAALGCLCLAAGVYQPVAVYPLATHVVAVALEVDRIGIKAALRRLSIGGAVIAAAVLLSHLISVGIIHWGGYSSDYIGGYLHVELLVDMPRKALGRTAALGRGLLSGTGYTFIDGCPAYAAFLILIAFWGVVALVVAKNKPRALFSTALVLGAVAGTIGVAVVNGGILPIRTLLGLPIALAGLAFAATGDRDRPASLSATARWSLAIGSAWCFLAFAEIGSRLDYSAYVTWLNDRALGQEIVARIDALPNLDPKGPISIEVSGYHTWPSSPMVPAAGGSPAGASFFGWDYGSAGRIVDFLKTLGRLNFEVASREQHDRIAESVAALPDWPRPGSVAEIGGVAVVKFGPYTAGQK